MRTVGNGLWLTRFALLVLVGAVGCLALLPVGDVLLHLLPAAPSARAKYYNFSMPTSVVAGGVGIIAMLLGFVGRCLCLATPPELSTARTRVRLAVLLEACGWLSSVANAGVAWAILVKWLSLPLAAVGYTGLFSVVVLAGGRVMFLRFARSVADVLGDEALVRTAARSLTLFVVVVACGAVGFGLFQLAHHLLAPSSFVYTFAFALGGGLWIAAAAVGLVGLFVYARLLGGLAKSVNGFAVAQNQIEEGA